MSYVCPKCKGDLAYYTQLGIMDPVLVFCPKCEIVASRWMSFPYLCKNCNGEHHFYLGGYVGKDHVCYFCGCKEAYTPEKPWHGKWDGNYGKKLQVLPNCTGEKHEFETVWERVEKRDADRVLVIKPLTLVRCKICKVEAYVGH